MKENYEVFFSVAGRRFGPLFWPLQHGLGVRASIVWAIYVVRFDDNTRRYRSRAEWRETLTCYLAGTMCQRGGRNEFTTWRRDLNRRWLVHIILVKWVRKDPKHSNKKVKGTRTWKKKAKKKIGPKIPKRHFLPWRLLLYEQPFAEKRTK